LVGARCAGATGDEVEAAVGAEAEVEVWPHPDKPTATRRPRTGTHRARRTPIP
jgi:hypothetical protein